jgi:hypothetical protein
MLQFSVPAAGCQSGFLTFTLAVPPAPPLIDSDIDLGIITYDDPFPAEWQRVFNFCQNAIITLPAVDLVPATAYILSNWQTSAPPTAELKPLVSAVVNPAINAATLFTPGTLDTKAVTVSWSKPALGEPFGYRVGLITTQTVTPPGMPSVERYVSAGTLSTSQTSVTVPPQLLTAGKTYLFTITALVDATANMETSPLRSGLPAAGADIISAPITISAGAQ